MQVNENDSLPHMKSLSTCLNRMVMEGYTEDFKITEQGLQGMNSKTLYSPAEVRVANIFRFEGMSDPNENAILYVIQTKDGIRGTLIDAYGIYHDPRIAYFMKQVVESNTNV